MTYKEAVYMCLDELKANSDDAQYTEDHVIFLLGKYRAFILKQRYSDVKKQIPESNYQTICTDLTEVSAIAEEPCEGGSYLRSKEKIPFLMKIGTPRVYPIDYYQGEITYVSRERMRYVGYNKYLQNIIYCSLGPDNYLYFKSSNPQYLYLEKVKVTGIFEDPQAASELQCLDKNGNIICGVLDREFPVEASLVPSIIELVVKELLGAEYRPKDSNNDATDDLSDIATFIKRNTKSEISKALE
jgi:hypothetical protein